jgi:flagellar hook assembly protein FlgD
VQFSTDERAEIQITVYDVLGREITRLANSTYYPGAYSVEWNGRSDQGLPMPSGIYYLRMIARTLSDEKGGSAPFTMMRKMIMMK